MFKYGTIQHKFVPGPQIRLRAISPIDDRSSSEAEAVIDTGAAMTCVPQRVIDEIGEGKLTYSQRIVRGAIGHESLKKTYILNLRVAKCNFENFEVIAFDREYALIGRDILNKYPITFDGPNKSWEVDKNVPG